MFAVKTIHPQPMTNRYYPFFIKSTNRYYPKSMIYFYFHEFLMCIVCLQFSSPLISG